MSKSTAINNWYGKSNDKRASKIKISQIKKDFADILLFIMIISLIFYSVIEINKWRKTSPLFNVSKIDIMGTVFVNSDSLFKKINLAENKNIFDYHLKTEAVKIINNFDFIKNAAIVRRQPSTLIIHIQERVPYGTIIIDKEVKYFDKEGFIFKKPDKAYPNVSPILMVNGKMKLDKNISCLPENIINIYSKMKQYLINIENTFGIDFNQMYLDMSEMRLYSKKYAFTAVLDPVININQLERFYYLLQDISNRKELNKIEEIQMIYDKQAKVILKET